MRLANWLKEHRLFSTLGGYFIFKIIVGGLLLIYLPRLFVVYIVIKLLFQGALILLGADWVRNKLKKK